MNIVVIQGRLTADAEIKMTPNGKQVTTFTIAVPRDKETTDFITVQAWEKKAEFVNRYFGKGKPITVIGELRVNTWEKDGQKRSSTYIHATDVQFAFGVPKETPPSPDALNPYVAQASEDEELPF